ncbi:MAG TPA: CAP domain-containing protein [Acidimicrobiia bacterium]|jgi:uncharacterized protein YkwD|nr:CAP domain-containing protein [Acidimicrobiia bacterium]
MNSRLLALIVVATMVLGVVVVWAGTSSEPEFATPVTLPLLEAAPSTSPLLDSDVLERHAEEEVLINSALVSTTSTTSTSSTTTTSTTTVATTAAGPPARTSSPPSTAVATTTAPKPAGPTHDSGAESEFAASINSYRGSNGSAALTRSGSLDSYARSWAKHMASSGTLSHSNIGSLLGEWSSVGENVGYGGSVDAVFDALAGSSGHRANMLGDFTHVGVGAYRDANGTLWTAHVFAR